MISLLLADREPLLLAIALVAGVAAAVDQLHHRGANVIAAPPPGLSVADRRRPSLPPDARRTRRCCEARPSAGCGARSGRSFAVHVELFARRRGRDRAAADRGRPQRLQLPAAHDGPDRGRRRRTDGTLDARRSLRVWGRRLCAVAAALVPRRVTRVRRRSASRRRSAAGSCSRRHAQIVLEIGGYVPPHPSLPVPERTSMTAAARRLRRSRCCSPVAAARPSRASRRSARRGRTRSSTSSRPGTAVAGKPTKVSFVIRQPNGKPLTDFRRGPGPHTGVHLIIVRRDLATIVHRHPPIAADGTISDTVTFARARPVPGRGRRVPEHDRAAAELPAVRLAPRRRVRTARRSCRRSPRRDVVDGYRFTLHGRPNLHAIQAGFLTITVTDPTGKPGAVHAVVRRARARDLLPAGLARLLPHARLRPRRGRLHERARRHDRSPAARRRPES